MCFAGLSDGSAEAWLRRAGRAPAGDVVGGARPGGAGDYQVAPSARKRHRRSLLFWSRSR
ncbi:hypothetical protein Skr01_68540 [Sphaerisporangium krabiense]|nr:hypothetical protein Skr01_68540 [Sphaerisporangium krabiense]